MIVQFPLSDRFVLKKGCTIMRKFGGTQAEPAFGWACGKVGRVKSFGRGCNCEVKFGSDTYDQPLLETNYIKQAPGRIDAAPVGAWLLLRRSNRSNPKA